MSQKIGVLSHTQNQRAHPERFISKNAANALIRRLLAVRISKGLIQMVAIREMSRALPWQPASSPAIRMLAYQHHIEPRLERLTQIELERQLDQDYLRFLWENQSAT